MRAIHDCNLCHRDLKTLNVFVDKRCTAKVADFGVSRLMNRRMSIHVGTVNYMAPEMQGWLPRESGHVDTQLVRPYSGERVDVWAFGFVLYEAFSSQLQDPDLMRDPRSWEEASQGKPPVAPSERRLFVDCPDDVFEALRGLMVRCWASEPDQRPPFWEIADILDRLLAQYNVILRFT